MVLLLDCSRVFAAARSMGPPGGGLYLTRDAGVEEYPPPVFPVN
jgi:hypothetical protein